MTNTTSADYCTIVDDLALRQAIRVWLFTPIIQLHTVAGEKQDLYLKLIAMAINQPYEATVQRHLDGDQGLQAARRKCKRIIFRRLVLDPTCVLQIHDESIVRELATVESDDAHQELENHAEQPLHPQA